MQKIADALGAVAVESTQISQQWGRATVPFHPQDAATERFSEIKLETLLESRLLRYPYLTIIHQGRALGGREFTTDRRIGNTRSSNWVDANKVMSWVERGATVMFQQSEQWITPIADFCRLFANQLHSKCYAVLFYTPAGNAGLAPHRDDTHVLAIQLQGRKSWQVERNAPADGNWPDHNSFDRTDWAVFETTNERGLYMPPGVLHATASQTETSLHLSVTILEPRIRDVVYLAALKLANEYSLHRFAPPGDDERREWISGLTRDMANRLAAMDPDALLDQVAKRTLSHI